MKFKEWLMEMPLANYRVAPFVKQKPEKSYTNSTYDHFTSGDRNVIKHATTFKSLEKALAKSTGFNFNIILMEYDPNFAKNRPGTLYIGKDQEFISQVREYCEKNNIPLENHITFAKNGSTGDPLTPWMILHTLGHALLDKSSGGGLRSALYEMYNLFSGSPPSFDNHVVNFLSQIFQFRSARQHQNPKGETLTLDEMIFDIVAEYLWHGFIRAKPIGNAKWPGLRGHIAIIEDNIKDHLKQEVGRIITDFFIPKTS